MKAKFIFPVLIILGLCLSIALSGKEAKSTERANVNVTITLIDTVGSSIIDSINACICGISFNKIANGSVISVPTDTCYVFAESLGITPRISGQQNNFIITGSTTNITILGKPNGPTNLCRK